MVPVGYLALAHLDPLVTRWVLSALVAAGLLAIAGGLRFPRDVGSATAVSVGGMSGFMNGLAQVGAPPLVLFWLSRDKPPETIRASAMLYFAFGTMVTMSVYLIGRLFTREVVFMSVWMAPVYALGMTLGGRLFGRASPRIYRRIAFGVIAGSVVAGLPIWHG